MRIFLNKFTNCFNCYFKRQTTISILQKLFSHPNSSFSTSCQLKSKRFSKKIYLNSYNILKSMNDPATLEILNPYQESVKEQGDIVRKLKEEKANEIDIKKAVGELKFRKKMLEDKVLELSKHLEGDQIDRAKLEDLLKQRFFYDASFAIYGGVAGLYDFGPMGCMVKTNLIQCWREMFVLEEQMLEVDCSMLTPEKVLQASGHVERFADTMVKDSLTGECFRTDHLISAAFEKITSDKKVKDEIKLKISNIKHLIESMTKLEMKSVIEKFNIKSPLTGNDLSEPIDFNLMFETTIGPGGKVKGFLRPETAQGIFVNFKRLLDFNSGKLPFAAAQIGNAFRNEISPRSGLIRVREFAMAEIEHFIDPCDKSHPKFNLVKDLKIPLYSACAQMSGKLPREFTLEEALKENIISSETIGYFIGRIYLFMLHIGLDSKKIRFRQHLANEMAHYAKDCWDGETKTTYGWVECVGCADRSCYDLQQHTKVTGVKLVAEKKYDSPIEKEVFEVVCNMENLGKQFKKEAKLIQKTLSNMNKEELKNLDEILSTKGVFTLKLDENQYELDKNYIEIKKYKKLFHVEEFTPNVIEPSFGIGRLIYSLFEHNFKIREGDEQRTYLTLPPSIAPFKCSVLPLSNQREFQPFISQLSMDLTSVGVSHKVDSSSTAIGRRYARTDQIAVPFGITVDFDSLKEPHTATLRERDSMKQIRAPISELAGIVRDLSTNKISWLDVTNTYPSFDQQEVTTIKN